MLRWLDRLASCQRRAALLERARFCHARGLALLLEGRREMARCNLGKAMSFRQAGLQHFRRRDALLREIHRHDR